MEEFSGKSLGEWTSRQKKDKTERVNRTRQKNKRGDSKVESNDSPEILDKEETSDMPGLPSGEIQKVMHYCSSGIKSNLARMWFVQVDMTQFQVVNYSCHGNTQVTCYSCYAICVGGHHLAAEHDYFAMETKATML